MKILFNYQSLNILAMCLETNLIYELEKHWKLRMKVENKEKKENRNKKE